MAASNRRIRHCVTIDAGPLDEVLIWVAFVVVLVFGAFGLALLLKWLVGA